MSRAKQIPVLQLWLRGDSFQESVIKINTRVKRFDAQTLILPMCPHIVPVDRGAADSVGRHARSIRVDRVGCTGRHGGHDWHPGPHFVRDALERPEYVGPKRGRRIRLRVRSMIRNTADRAGIPHRDFRVARESQPASGECPPTNAPARCGSSHSPAPSGAAHCWRDPHRDV